MLIVNFTNPITVLLAVALVILVVYLGKETHKSWCVAVMLFVFLTLLVGHAVRLFNFGSSDEVLYKAITTSVLMDFVFIFLSFMSYLWIDDIQAKVEKKKSISNSLDWFWAKV